MHATSFSLAHLSFNSPWNFPWVLTFKPLLGAIAAGCAAVLKPSEVSAHSAALMAELVPKYLDPTAFAVVNGGVTETTALLNLRWAHIFYTGGVAVGRVIAAAAAKFVTPLTLELGGKSPVIVDEGIDLDLAARRILNGKSVNAGQASSVASCSPLSILKLFYCSSAYPQTTPSSSNHSTLPSSMLLPTHTARFSLTAPSTQKPNGQK